MSKSRRTFVRTIGTSSVILLAGCSSDEEVEDSDGDGVIDSEDYAPYDPDIQSEDDVSQSTDSQNRQGSPDTQDTQDSQIEQETSPEPEVIATEFPEPQAVSLDQTHIRGDTYEFSAMIENTGSSGDINITLQWLNEDGVSFEDVQSIERYFNSGERREETITTQMTDSYPQFGFDLVAATLTATVENSGGPGEVKVGLYKPVGNSSIVITTTTVQMAAGETRDVEIEPESGVGGLIADDAEIRADSSE